MSSRVDDVREELDDEPTITEALELWAYLENPREVLTFGREERRVSIDDE